MSLKSLFIGAFCCFGITSFVVSANDEPVDTTQVVASVCPDEDEEHICQQPCFPGGEMAMYQFLAANIKYPTAAAQDAVQGRVVLRFVVMPSGSIDSVEVTKSIHPALDAEAVRLVKMMPKWQPGKIDGKPVAVHYDLPVTFKLTVEKPKKGKKK